MILSAKGLNHTYKTFKKREGMNRSIIDLVRRDHTYVSALKSLDFEIEKNQIVGLVGPNGAGKTTTLKILTGIIQPSGGEVEVLGFNPYRKQREFKESIAFMMGNKSQLIWDLPAYESFNLNRVLYNIPKRQFRDKIDHLLEVLDITEKLYIPVRNLSLGERMKMEFIACLIHSPKIIFMDEPTLGMDLVTQRSLREYILSYFRTHDVTVIITSHNVADVEVLCDRVAIISQGEKIFDGDMQRLKDQHKKYRLVKVTLEDGASEQEAGILLEMGFTAKEDLLFEKMESIGDTTKTDYKILFEKLRVKDISMENENLESIIATIFDERAVK